MTAPKQQLSLFDAVSIVLGVIIGAGIFGSTPLVAAQMPSGNWLLAMWMLGGVLSFIGALCYAELASSMPHEGGDYVYLTRTFGRWLGFLFAWCEFWIIRPGSIGAMAYVFANYAAEFLFTGPSPVVRPLLATAAIVALTLVNLFGVRSGKWTQNVLSLAKVLGLLAVIAAGLIWAPLAIAPPASTAAVGGSTGNLSLALILVLFAYGGWNDISFVAAEVRHPQRNMFRALALGILGVSAIYLLLNLALLRGLGLEGLASSASAPAQLLERAVGPSGSGLVSMLICLATLGAINAMIFTGSRIYYALGREHKLYAFLGHWSPRFDAPVRAVLLQSLVAVGLVVSFGRNDDQFENLVMFTTPLFWLFIMLAGVATIVLRLRLPELERPFRMPLFPLPALVLCATALFMTWQGLVYSISKGHLEGLWTLGMFLLGLVLCWWERLPRLDGD